MKSIHSLMFMLCVWSGSMTCQQSQEIAAHRSRAAVTMYPLAVQS
jgi:hypothetical protein